MAVNAPPQGSTYLGPITDTRRWVPFKHRPDDIFVCTPPKCGTTWTQAICAMFVFGGPDHGHQPGVVSPWVDAVFSELDDCMAQVEAQTHRRYLKTHTPLDGIPYHEECTYLVIFRDPRDTYFSGSNHRDNMNDQELALAVFPSGQDAFEEWLHKVRPDGVWDLTCLDSLCHFMNTYWPYRDLPNVHLFHYSDMKRDLRSAVARMAAATGTELSDAQLDAYAAAADFGAMKAKADQFAPESGTGMWKAETNFFANGSSGQWERGLTDAQKAAFAARFAALIPDAEQARWMLNGNGEPSG
jgi:aryl sulfotransferase